MPRPNGPQFIQLYRGLQEATPETLDKHRMGPHWTTDYDVARDFAGVDWEGSPGTIVGAKVHRRHIIEEGSQEWENVKDRWGVIGSDDPRGRYESERTVRPGAMIHVTEITHFPEEGESRTVKRQDMKLGELRKFRA